MKIEILLINFILSFVLLCSIFILIIIVYTIIKKRQNEVTEE